MSRPARFASAAAMSANSCGCRSDGGVFTRSRAIAHRVADDFGPCDELALATPTSGRRPRARRCRRAAGARRARRCDSAGSSRRREARLRRRRADHRGRSVGAASEIATLRVPASERRATPAARRTRLGCRTAARGGGAAPRPTATTTGAVVAPRVASRWHSPLAPVAPRLTRFASSRRANAASIVVRAGREHRPVVRARRRRRRRRASALIWSAGPAASAIEVTVADATWGPHRPSGSERGPGRGFRHYDSTVTGWAGSDGAWSRALCSTAATCAARFGSVGPAGRRRAR